MLFSVVIPTYNRAELLRIALDSVFTQTFTDYEVIVVDDGSTDDTQEMVKSYAERLQVFRQENAGPGAARNLGVAHARGEYIAFLDSDDLWFPWALALFAALIHRHPSPAVLSGRVVEFVAETELSTVRDEPVRANVFGDYFAASATGYYIGSNRAVIRREEFLNVGGFATSRINAEDHDFALRLGTARGFVQVLAPVTLAWRRHERSATRNVRRTVRGVCYLVEQEQCGVYPGGAPRARERREIICRHVRPVALECLRRGMRSEAWKLYRATLRWHCQLRRWKFLLGFPLRACLPRQ